MNGRLYRSRRDRMLGGVAGGLAGYLNVDPALVRIIWAVLVFTTGGLFGLIYIVMWIVVPEAPAGYEPDAWRGRAFSETGEEMAPGSGEPRPVNARRSGDGRLILGGILILIGLYFLLRSYLPEIAWDRFWPIVLVLAGVALLVASLGRNRSA